MLQTITAVMFTNRLRGVKTCNLCTTVAHACGGFSGKFGLFHPQGVFRDVPYESQIIPDGRVIRVEREILHYGKLLSGNGGRRD